MSKITFFCEVGIKIRTFSLEELITVKITDVMSPSPITFLLESDLQENCQGPLHRPQLFLTCTGTKRNVC